MMRTLSVILIISFSFVYIGSSFAEGFVGTSESLSTTKISPLSAESRLKMLAIKRKAERETGGCLLMGTGCLSIVLGAAYASQSTTHSEPYGITYTVDNGPAVTALVGVGVLLIGLGILSENVPSPIEAGSQQISSMASSTEAEKREKEVVAASLLKRYSDDAHAGRMISSTLNLGLGAIYLATPPFQVVGAMSVGLSAIGFFVKSDVEQEYEEYLTRKGSIESH